MLGMSLTDIALGVVVFISKVLHLQLFIKEPDILLPILLLRQYSVLSLRQLHTKSTDICN